MRVKTPPLNGVVTPRDICCEIVAIGASSSELLKATNYEDDEADNQHEPSER
jgi:hypothetical protein